MNFNIKSIILKMEAQVWDDLRSYISTLTSKRDSLSLTSRINLSLSCLGIKNVNTKLVKIEAQLDRAQQVYDSHLLSLNHPDLVRMVLGNRDVLKLIVSHLDKKTRSRFCRVNKLWHLVCKPKTSIETKTSITLGVASQFILGGSDNIIHGHVGGYNTLGGEDRWLGYGSCLTVGYTAEYQDKVEFQKPVRFLDATQFRGPVEFHALVTFHKKPIIKK